MDEADQAQDHMEREQAGMLARRKPSGPIATGRCLCCDTLLARGMRWCDSACRDDWEKENE